MEKHKRINSSFRFFALSTGVLRSESDNSLEKWWSGKRATGDWFGVRPALDDRGIHATGKSISTFRAGGAFALGNYCYDKIFLDHTASRTVHQTYEGLFECDYRTQVNKWTFVQPFLQYPQPGLVAHP